MFYSRYELLHLYLFCKVPDNGFQEIGSSCVSTHYLLFQSNFFSNRFSLDSSTNTCMDLKRSNVQEVLLCVEWAAISYIRSWECAPVKFFNTLHFVKSKFPIRMILRAINDFVFSYGTLRCLVNGGVKINSGDGKFLISGGGVKISGGRGVLKTSNFVVQNNIPKCCVRNRFKQ